MEPILIFNVSNQEIERIDEFTVVESSASYLKAQFNFLTDDWAPMTIITGVFIMEDGTPIPSLADAAGICKVPEAWLVKQKGYVGVIGSDGTTKITTNSVKVRIKEKGYTTEKMEEEAQGYFDQIMAAVASKADGLSYKNNILKLLSGEAELARVTITGGSGSSREIELQKGTAAIQWRYVGDDTWTDLVALEDLKGEAGPAGQPGKDGADGAPGSDGITPHIGDNGNWYLGDTDTGKPSRGETGPAGQDGEPGADGTPGKDGKSAYEYAQNGLTASSQAAEDKTLAISCAALFKPWKPGKYEVGAIRTDGTTPYECMIAHDSTVNTDWTIDVRSIWKPYHSRQKAWALPFIQPTGAHDMYLAGEYMVYTDGKTYMANQDTSYSPEDYPQAWDLVE